VFHHLCPVSGRILSPQPDFVETVAGERGVTSDLFVMRRFFLLTFLMHRKKVLRETLKHVLITINNTVNKGMRNVWPF
jgi:hypothetical protein